MPCHAAGLRRIPSFAYAYVEYIILVYLCFELRFSGKYMFWVGVCPGRVFLGANMNFHEYQAKEIFASYGIPVPAGTIAQTPDEAVIVAQGLGGHRWVVKAQVHAGGRGKAGGVKLVSSLDEVRSEAHRMLNMSITTYQTGGLALPVDSEIGRASCRERV